MGRRYFICSENSASSPNQWVRDDFRKNRWVPASIGALDTQGRRGVSAKPPGEVHLVQAMRIHPRGK